MYNENRLLFIDVRKKSEFDAEHVEGSINIPLNQLSERLAEIPKDRSFILFCGGGYRSMIAASMLKQRGYESFADVLGGFKSIKETQVKISQYVCPSTLL